MQCLSSAFTLLWIAEPLQSSITWAKIRAMNRFLWMDVLSDLGMLLDKARQDIVIKWSGGISVWFQIHFKAQLIITKNVFRIHRLRHITLTYLNLQDYNTKHKSISIIANITLAESNSVLRFQSIQSLLVQKCIHCATSFTAIHPTVKIFDSILVLIKI